MVSSNKKFESIEELMADLNEPPSKWKIIYNILDWFGRPIRHACYWLRYRFHPKYRYHIIKTGLRPGYYDQDVLLLHACMTLLKRYVAWYGGEEKLEEFIRNLKERPNAWGCGPDDMAPHIHRQMEVLAIYRWWKYEYFADEKRLDDLFKAPLRDRKGDEIEILEEKLFDDEQKMLHRLIDIRRFLWE